ncbi:MAG: molybdenum cofactor biosynthesis protein MoaE [Fluviicoccus sp.]|uniref:molybdenum cofactor biosynthesis protein MoaE n=1 Tax=Fluviicoccus sp. TaxID=2003552 RepID=UPI00271C5404|nr:molybdenum cofactor biosynthesis protein MoaE [Fluviicoccus sp.]MDO8329179.1 molybdenum cofactor biosynthesis protein MoaE [Fluviicoccus sp.]
MISIQTADFDTGAEIRALQGHGSIGAVVSFTGLVRDMASHGAVTAIELEHYPAMTQRSLETIVEQARSRWPLLGVRVIHRVGYLSAGEQIVLVVVSSAHRHAAFDAAGYIMDFLKSRAPFWKKEYVDGQGHWVEAKVSDESALDRWSQD